MSKKILILAMTLIAAFALSGCVSPGKNALEKSKKVEAAEETHLTEEGGTPTAQSTKDREAEDAAGTEGDADKGDAKPDKGDKPAKGDKGGKDGAAMVDVKDAKFDPQRDAFGSSCGGCHMLADANASGTVGPDLDQTKFTVQQIDDQIINGGGAMPPGLLTGDDSQAMAEYVAAAAAAAQK